MTAPQSGKWLGFNMIIFLARSRRYRRGAGAAELDNCGWLAKLVYIIIPMLRRRSSTSSCSPLSASDGLRPDLDHDFGGPLWSTETVSTYIYKRAFNWNTFDLGYPGDCRRLVVLILVFVLLINRLLRLRDSSSSETWLRSRARASAHSASALRAVLHAPEPAAPFSGSP